MNFILDRNKDFEINRLINQATCWQEEAELLFDRIDIHPGWKCVDLGCGPMGVLDPLSRRVGVSGQVTGVDHNPYYIQAAKKFINQKHLTNVLVINGDLFNNSLKSHSFNLCHMRFVFSEKGCDRKLLEKMIDLTQPGGVIVSQESDWTTWKCYPQKTPWSIIRNAMIALFEYKGGDINAGLRTFQMFNETDLSEIQIRTAILAMPLGHPYRSGLVQFALSMREKIISAHILTKNEFDKQIDECKEVIMNPNVIILSYTLTQVWGWVKCK